MPEPFDYDEYAARVRRHLLSAASTTDLTAIAYIAGHKHIVTTAKYVRGREEGAADALAARQTTTAKAEKGKA